MMSSSSISIANIIIIVISSSSIRTLPNRPNQMRYIILGGLSHLCLKKIFQPICAISQTPDLLHHKRCCHLENKLKTYFRLYYLCAFLNLKSTFILQLLYDFCVIKKNIAIGIFGDSCVSCFNFCLLFLAVTGCGAVYDEQSERINDEYQEMRRRHDATSAAQSTDHHLYVNDQASPGVSFTTHSDAGSDF